MLGREVRDGLEVVEKREEEGGLLRRKRELLQLGESLCFERELSGYPELAGSRSAEEG